MVKFRRKLIVEINFRFLESRLHTHSGELDPSWSVLSSSSQQPNNRSKFFDGFQSNNTEPMPSNRPQQQQRWPSNQISRPQNNQYDERDLPMRQPFFSNDRSYPQQQQQQDRYSNGNMQYQQRNFYNNRRPPMNNQQRRPGTGGNRETFHDHGNNYNDDFDFETSNQKFNKITTEEDLQQPAPSSNQFLQSNNDSADHEPIYDKKKSFFDNTHSEETSDMSGPMYNRSRNYDTFGNDRNQRQGGNRGGYRRTNNSNNYRQQQGNENYQYRQNNNNNGYQYRY